MFRLFAASAILLVTATGASAAPSEDAKGDGKDKVICKSEAVTGSRLKKRRTCMTAEQWAELSSQTQKSISDFSRASGNLPTVKNPMTGQ